MQRYNFFRHFLSWLYFISSVGCILFPQLAVFRFLSWLYSKSQGYIRYVIRSLFHLFGLNNGNKKGAVSKVTDTASFGMMVL